MKKIIGTSLIALFALGGAQATVVNIDLTTNTSRGPTANKLPGVVGIASDVTWNPVGSKDLYANLVAEDGSGTGASFQITGEGGVSFGSTAGSATSFFNTQAFLSGSGEPGPAATNSFTIGGMIGSTVDLYLYATWEYIDAGSEFRVSGDGGSSWTEWQLCSGVPSEDDAGFTNGQSYVVFSGVDVHTDGTVLGEWQTTTNGASIANRGVFSAVQVVGEFDDPAAPEFTEDPFSMPYAEAGVAYTNSIAGTATGSGLEYSLLTTGTWLSMATDGTITGTPAESDIGINTFSVQVTDELARSVSATMTIEVKELLVPAWEFNFEGTGTSDAAGSRRYTAFGVAKDGLGDGNVFYVNSNTGSSNPGPGFFYIPTGLAWEPNTLYTIDFLMCDRGDTADGAIAEYGLFAGLPADDVGAGQGYIPVTGTVSPWIASSNASLGVEGQVTYVDLGGTSGTVHGNEKASVVTGSTASDTAFSFTTPNDVSGLGEMVFFIRSGDDGLPNGGRIHADELKIYATPAIETPDTPELTITAGAGAVTVSAGNLSAEAYVVNYLQYKENLAIGDTWNNLYSVTGVTETNWTIAVSNSPVFYRIEAAY